MTYSFLPAVLSLQSSHVHVPVPMFNLSGVVNGLVFLIARPGLLLFTHQGTSKPKYNFRFKPLALRIWNTIIIVRWLRRGSWMGPLETALRFMFNQGISMQQFTISTYCNIEHSRIWVTGSAVCVWYGCYGDMYHGILFILVVPQWDYSYLFWLHSEALDSLSLRGPARWLGMLRAETDVGPRETWFW